MYNINTPVGLRYKLGFDETIKEVKRCGVPRIALGIGREPEGEFGFSTLDTIEYLKENIKKFRDNGIEVMVWLGQTFGHDKSPVGDDYVSDYSNQHLIGQGRVTAYCPLDSDFKKRFCDEVKHKCTRF